MRIRVRVPQDGEEKPVGLFGWLKGLFTRPDPPTPPAAPAPTGDKRWAKHGSARYFTAGRLCVRTRGQWESEYLFDVDANGQVQQIRVVLPESDVATWETAKAARMPEALRLRLARETLMPCSISNGTRRPSTSTRSRSKTPVCKFSVWRSPLSAPPVPEPVPLPPPRSSSAARPASSTTGPAASWRTSACPV